MAIVRYLEKITLERGSQHTEVNATYTIVHSDDGDYLQIDTYGSRERQEIGKKQVAWVEPAKPRKISAINPRVSLRSTQATFFGTRNMVSISSTKDLLKLMVAYRRNFIPGGCYFFTVTLLDRSSSLLVDRIDDLREAMRSVRAERPFTMDAVVVLPDHLHCIWTLPPGDVDYSLRWREIKSRFSRRVPLAENRTTGHKNKAERGIWQRRFWEHTLRDPLDVERHVDYIHYNPVKHGYAYSVENWPHSSFHRYVERGEYPQDWAGVGQYERGGFGE